MILIKKIKAYFSYLNNLSRRLLSQKRRIIILLIIDIILFIIELVIGLIANSLALFADSFHLLNDVVSLIISLWSIKLALRKNSSAKYTYGWQRAEVLGALINGIFLMALCLTIFLQAIQRFFEKDEIHNPRAIFVVGIIGILTNILGLFLFHDFKHQKNKYSKDEEGIYKYNSDKNIVNSFKSDIFIENYNSNEYLKPHIVDWLGENSKNDSLIQRLLDEHTNHNHAKQENNIGYVYSNLNMKGVFLHVFGDILGNISVVITALFIWLTDFSWKYYVDPAISIFISIIIFINALPLVKSSSLILLQVAPKNIRVMEIKEDISNIIGVLSVHELHIWQLSDTKLIASAHILTDISFDNAEKYTNIVASVRHCLHAYGIHSSTIQLEFQGVYPHKAFFSEDNEKSSCLLRCVGGEECLNSRCCVSSN